MARAKARQKCPVCGKLKSFPKGQPTCSLACGAEWRRGRLGSQCSPSGHILEKRKCAECGKVKTFEKRKQYCSAACATAARRHPHPQKPPDLLLKEKSLKAERDALRRQLDKVLAAQVADAKVGAELERALSRPLQVPNWVTTPTRKRAKTHRVVAMAKFSDWHFGEHVNPAEVRWLNGYDQEIQHRRLTNFFQSLSRLTLDYMKGFEYAGIVVPSLGDIVTGDIHEDIKLTAYAPTLSIVLEFVPLMAAGLSALAAQFGRVWVPWVCGNHGRTTRKPRYKQRVETNYDWLFGELVARALEDDKRVTVTLPRSAKYVCNVYNTTFLLSHGDEARGGSGIASLLSPLMIADARMRKTVSYDYWCLGHWHQQAAFKRCEVNGAGKGYDEYALGKNLDFDWPQQDLSIIDPKYGVICHWPIRIIEPGSESWMEHCPLPIPGQGDGPTKPLGLAEIPFSSELPL